MYIVATANDISIYAQSYVYFVNILFSAMHIVAQS